MGSTPASHVFSGAGAAAGVGELLSTGNSVALTAIPALSLDEVVYGFAQQDQVLRALDDEMSDMARKLADFGCEYGAGADLLTPLPVVTDVRALGYTYVDVHSEAACRHPISTD